jgi:hypothetical protein
VLEAKALAVLGALDKGVSLSPEALERYARFFEMPEEGFAGDGAGDAMEGDASSQGGAPGQGGGGERREPKERPKANELKAVAEEGAAKDGILNILNPKLGKDFLN